ncbi:hypothetical protein Tco_0575413 [Tanacetum coccineum]
MSIDQFHSERTQPGVDDDGDGFFLLGRIMRMPMRKSSEKVKLAIGGSVDSSGDTPAECDGSNVRSTRFADIPLFLSGYREQERVYSRSDINKNTHLSRKKPTRKLFRKGYRETFNVDMETFFPVRSLKNPPVGYIRTSFSCGTIEGLQSPLIGFFIFALSAMHFASLYKREMTCLESEKKRQAMLTKWSNLFMVLTDISYIVVRPLCIDYPCKALRFAKIMQDKKSISKKERDKERMPSKIKKKGKGKTRMNNILHVGDDDLSCSISQKDSEDDDSLSMYTLGASLGITLDGKPARSKNDVFRDFLSEVNNNEIPPPPL